MEGNLLTANQRSTRYGDAWYSDELGFVNTSEAQDWRKRVANNAKKGYFVGTIRVEARDGRDGLWVPTDDNYQPNVMDIVDNGKMGVVSADEQMELLASEDATPAMVAHALTQDDHDLQIAALKSSAVTTELAQQAFADADDDWVKIAALSSTGATPEWATEVVAEDEDWLPYVLDGPGATEAMAEKGMQSDRYWTRKAAINSSGGTRSLAEQALDDVHAEVRATAQQFLDDNPE